MRAVWAIAKLVIKEIFRKKDFYVAFALAGVILLYAQSFRFYNAKNVSRYLADIGLALIYLLSVVLAAALAARQFPSEIQNRTGPLLMAKPISRAQFVAGKYLGSFLASVSAFTLFFGIFLAALYFKAGVIDTVTALQAYALFVFNLAVFCAMVSALSYQLTAPANVTISLILYHFISLYSAELRASTSYFYYILPHFEFFDIRQRLVHDWGPIQQPLVGFLAVYALCYVAFFLSVAYLALRRRPL